MFSYICYGYNDGAIESKLYCCCQHPCPGLSPVAVMTPSAIGQLHVHYYIFIIISLYIANFEDSIEIACDAELNLMYAARVSQQHIFSSHLEIN